MAYPVLSRPRMNVSLYQAAAAMNAQARWQEMITQNLAAGSVPGFRKQDISFSAVQAGADATALNTPGAQYLLPTATAATNFEEGEMRATGNSMDFAIEGSGFFQVQLSNGSTGYSRDGEFHINAQGQLVTKQGYAVLGDGGPLQFDPNSSAPLTVASTGEISQGDQAKGRIHIVEFDNPHSLTAIGAGYFLADRTVVPGAASASSIRQGFLEGSNTSPTTEMASLITAMRMFEANQKVLQMQDERMGLVISDLGGTS